MKLENIAQNWGLQHWLVLMLLIAGLLMLVASPLVWRRKQRAAAGVFALIGVALGGVGIAIVAQQPEGFRNWLVGEEADEDNTAEQERLREQALTTTPPTRDDWPQWRGPGRDGVGVATGLSFDWAAKPPRKVWSVPCGGGFSSPTVTGGRVYLQDHFEGQERVTCFDAADGKQLWAHAYPADYQRFTMSYGNGPRATPTVHDGRPYALGATGQLLCLEASPADNQPKVLWQHDLMAEFNARFPSWGFASSPLIEDDLAIVQAGGEKGSIVAFDCQTGEFRRAALDDPNGYSSPIAATITGTRQIVAFTGDNLVGLNPADFKVLWKYRWATQNHGNVATPIVSGDTIFISSNYGAGCALLRIEKSGSRFEAVPVFVRRNKLMRNHHMTCVLHNGCVYGFDSGRGDLKCVDLKKIDECWDSQRLSKGTVLLVGDHLIVAAGDGDLALVEATPKEFRMKGRIDNVLSGGQCWTLPALAAGRLYLRDDSRLVCMDLR